METLKFLFISTHYPPHHLGGDAVFVQYLSEELSRRGHEVHVFHNPAVYQLLRRTGRNDKAAGGRQQITAHPLASSGSRFEPLFALSLGRWDRADTELKELRDRLRPDVIHWHNTRGLIGKPFSFAGSVSLFTAHDYMPVCPRANLLKPGMRPCEEAQLCTVCCMRWRRPPQLWRAGKRRVIHPDSGLRVISPSEFLANRLGKEGVAVHKVLRNFAPDIGDKFHRVASDDDTLVYLGLLDKHKGIHVLLDAFCDSSSEQGFKLWIIGNGPLKEELALRAHLAGMSDRVTVTGFLDRNEVESIRRNAAAQVVPSLWYENAPLTALEAYSLGVPILASRIGGLPEMATPEAGSETFCPGDVTELSSLIVKLWNNKDSLEPRRRKARATYEERYAPDIHLTEYLRFINEP
jgi:glycosyltransferase involved in cell wall biosynthesis